MCHPRTGAENLNHVTFCLSHKKIKFDNHYKVNLNEIKINLNKSLQIIQLFLYGLTC